MAQKACQTIPSLMKLPLERPTTPRKESLVKLSLASPMERPTTPMPCQMCVWCPEMFKNMTSKCLGVGKKYCSSKPVVLNLGSTKPQRFGEPGSGVWRRPSRKTLQLCNWILSKFFPYFYELEWNSFFVLSKINILLNFETLFLPFVLCWEVRLLCGGFIRVRRLWKG